MLVLVFISIFMGSVLRWLIFPTCYIICLPFYLKLLTLFVCIFGGLSGYFISNVSLYFYNKSLRNFNLVRFLGSMWFLPILSTLGVSKYPLQLGASSLKSIDQGWREYLGGQNIYNSIRNFSQNFQNFQNNSLKIYLLSFFLWFLILLIFNLLII